MPTLPPMKPWQVYYQTHKAERHAYYEAHKSERQAYYQENKNHLKAYQREYSKKAGYLAYQQMYRDWNRSMDGLNRIFIEL